MEVTSANFDSTFLSSFETILMKADFVAIDTEFSGLSDNISGRDNPYDSPIDRYMKKRKHSMDFTVLQYGICAFVYDCKNRGYDVYQYCFYVYPDFSRRYGHEFISFSSQASSIDFLASNKFDFNKLFVSNVPFISENRWRSLEFEIDNKYCKTIEELYDTRIKGEQVMPIFPSDRKEFLDSVCEIIGNFMSSNEDVEVNLPECDRYCRKLIHETINFKYDNTKLHVQTKEKKDPESYDRSISIKKVTTGESLELNRKSQDTEMDELSKAAGFTKAILLLIKHAKLIVGHNMMFDLLHTIDKFITPLPEDYTEFKELVVNRFPNMVDTKLMAQMQPLRSIISGSGLKTLSNTVKAHPFRWPKLNPMFEAESAPVFHDAGFDAFSTGCCFISMSDYLGSFDLCYTAAKSSTSSAFIQKFHNKIFMMKMEDCPYMDLAGSDPERSRDHMFDVSFPKAWTAKDLRDLFSECGSIQISWVDDTSACVILRDKALSQNVVRLLCNGDHGTEATVTRHCKNFEGAGEVKAPPKKRLSSHQEDESANKKIRQLFQETRVSSYTECSMTEVQSNQIVFDEPNNWDSD